MKSFKYLALKTNNLPVLMYARHSIITNAMKAKLADSHPYYKVERTIRRKFVSV